MNDAAPDQRRDDRSERWVCFELATQSYALPILSVQEVLSGAEIEPVPGAPRTVLGVVNLRGTIVTVLDLRLRLGLPAAHGPLPSCLVIVDGPGEAVAVQVDRVVDVRCIACAAIKPLPRCGNAATPELLGVVCREEQTLTLLDALALVSPLNRVSH